MASKRSRNAFEADLQKKESPYVFFGTPLPPLDEHTRDDGSYVPVWQQEVTDDRGRKRLHGAFTGGFSAGYYNTVGSKEGWTPSTFISSRQNRAKDLKDVKEQRAEDFMDEEDLREQEESRHLSTSEEFAGFGGTENDPQRLGGLMDLFRPSGESIGTKLLKKMGWREGQGIGPRIRRKASLNDGNAEESETHLFAPENPQMISFARKTDRQGVGYSTGGDSHSLLPTPQQRTGVLGDASLPSEDNNISGLGSTRLKPRISDQAKKSSFGVGVLNDTGSDDEDPFEIRPRISYNRVIGGDKKSKNKVVSLGGSNPLLKDKPMLLSKKSLTARGLAGFRKCHDGRLPLDGFVLLIDTNISPSLSIPARFKPPEVPSDWVPSSRKSDMVDQIATPAGSVKDVAKTSTLDPKSRAAILGEAQLPGKSVFDYLNPSARDRIARATGNTNLPTARNEKALSSHDGMSSLPDPVLQDRIPQLDPAVAIQALARAQNGWMPYSEDESKRLRYRAYLDIRAADLTDTIPPRAPGVSADDYINELSEFARAAQVFKPVTGLMASRFTSSTQQTPVGETTADDRSDETLLTKPVAKPEDPAEAAAKMGMFGPGLTRSTVNWYPTRLLCKRFNVPPPDHAVRDDQHTTSTSTFNQHFPKSGAGYGTDSRSPPSISALRESAVESADVNSSQPMKSASDASAPTQPATQTFSNGVLAIDPNRNEALEQERPGQAVFKAIFGDDDDDDD